MLHITLLKSTSLQSKFIYKAHLIQRVVLTAQLVMKSLIQVQRYWFFLELWHQFFGKLGWILCWINEQYLHMDLGDVHIDGISGCLWLFVSAPNTVTIEVNTTRRKSLRLLVTDLFGTGKSAVGVEAFGDSSLWQWHVGCALVVFLSMLFMSKWTKNLLSSSAGKMSPVWEGVYGCYWQSE